MIFRSYSSRWMKPLKKENLWQKSFSSDNTEWSSKNLWKMISADVEPNIKQLKKLKS